MTIQHVENVGTCQLSLLVPLPAKRAVVTCRQRGQVGRVRTVAPLLAAPYCLALFKLVMNSKRCARMPGFSPWRARA